jgi:hypothetical protein
VPGAKAWRSSWASILEEFVTVFVVGDGDEPGHKLAWSVKTDFPWIRIVRLLPGEDARSTLQQPGGDAVLIRAMEQATWDLVAHLGLAECASLDVYEAWLRQGEEVLLVDDVRARMRRLDQEADELREQRRQQLTREMAEDARARHEQALRDQATVEIKADELAAWTEGVDG